MRWKRPQLLRQLLRTREVELAQGRAEASSAEALITHLRLTIERLKRDLFGPRNERKARLIDQMELQLEELEAAAAEDELGADKVAAASIEDRRHPSSWAVAPSPPRNGRLGSGSHVRWARVFRKHEIVE
jgi:hypothetical protein